MKNALLATLALVAAPAVAPLAAQDTSAVRRPVTATPASRVEVPVDRVVAVVGDQPILWSGVQERVYEKRASGMPIPSDSAGALALARTVVGELVDEELLLAKAKQE